MNMESLRVLSLLGACAITFADVTLFSEKTDKGIISSVSVGKIMMTDSEGKNERGYIVPMEAKVVLNNREAKLTDFEKGDAVVVTVGMEGEVIKVAATRTKKPSTNLSSSHSCRDDLSGHGL